MHGTINIKLTAYSCICWLFHRIYYDARNHKHKKLLQVFLIREVPRQNLVPQSEHTTRVSLDTKVNIDNRIRRLIPQFTQFIPKIHPISLSHII